MTENKLDKHNHLETGAIPVAETILSETEAAKYLKLSKMTILRLRQSNQLPFYRVGFRILYSVEKHLLPFLEKCERKADSQELQAA